MFIVPEPKKYTRTEGEFHFSDKLFITLPAGDYEKLIPVMSEIISNYTAGKTHAEFIVSEKEGDTAHICGENKAFSPGKALTEYEYELYISPNGARLIFSDRAGLVHALVSFLHLVRIEDGGAYAPCYSILDKPDVSFRAIHLCVFKNTTLMFLKKVIGLCGMMKITHIILEFWGSYRYECCPSLAWKGAYTKEDISPLIDYANGLGLEVIPMLNHLGHASQGRVCFGKHSALDTDISLAPLFDDDGWAWCTTNPKTLELLAKCRAELIELCGKSSYFHIGFDEAYTFGDCERCRKYDRKELMKQHLINITEDLRRYGRRPIMWADMMIDSRGFDRKIYEINDNGEHVIRPYLPRDIIMADWQYNCTEEFKTSDQLAADGFDVMTCPWNIKANVDAAVDTAKHKKLAGVIGTTWHTLSSMEWLIPHIAEKSWGEPVLSDVKAHLCCAYHVRRLVPANGVYEDAGFYHEELPSYSI